MEPKLRAEIPKPATADDSGPRAPSVIHFHDNARTGIFQGWGPKI